MSRNQQCFLFFVAFTCCISVLIWYGLVSHTGRTRYTSYRKLVAYGTTLTNFHPKVSKLESGNRNNISFSDETGREGCYVYRKGRLAITRREVSSSLQKQLKCLKQRPSVAIIGVKKCGTETLTGMLDLHPNIVTKMYPVWNGCCMDLSRPAFDRNTPFTTSDEIALLNMIGLQYAPENISTVLEYMSENPKFVVIFKDPSKRALSDYVHVTGKMKGQKGKKSVTSVKREPVWTSQRRDVTGNLGKVTYFKGYKIAGSFEKSILNASGVIEPSDKLVSLGCYDAYIDSILKVIPRENVLFVDGAKFMDEPWVVLKKIESFLGVSSFFDKKHFQKENGYYCAVVKDRPDSGCLKGKGRAKPSIDKDVWKMLNDYYRQRNQRIVRLTGITFSWM